MACAKSSTRPAEKPRQFCLSPYIEPLPSVRGSRRGSKRPGLRFGGDVFVETVWAIPRGGLEQAGRLVLGTDPQGNFAAVEIGLADLVLLYPRVRIVGDGEDGGGRHLTEEHTHHRRGPYRHVELRRYLRQPARHIVAPADDVEPQRAVRILWIKCACLVDVGQGFGELAGVEIGASPVAVGRAILGINPYRLGEIGDGRIEFQLVEMRAAAIVEDRAVPRS